MYWGKNVLTQAMMNEPNTTYVIQYDYDLDGGELIVPNKGVHFSLKAEVYKMAV